MNLRRRTALFLFLAVLANGLLNQRATLAQSSFGPLLRPASDNVTPTPGMQPSIADKRAENADQLRVAQRRLEEDPADPIARVHRLAGRVRGGLEHGRIHHPAERPRG